MIDPTILIEAQKANLTDFARLSATRPEGHPRADWLATNGFRNLAFFAVDTAHTSRPRRQVVLAADSYRVDIYTATMKHCLDSFDLRAADAAERLATLERAA